MAAAGILAFAIVRRGVMAPAAGLQKRRGPRLPRGPRSFSPL